MNTGFIYKITNGDMDYYGSTNRALNIRLIEHISKYKRYLKGQYNFVSSFNIIKNANDNLKIELMEEVKYDDKKYLLQKEKEYILNNECCNKIIPTQTKAEYYMKNREKILMKRKQNRELKKIAKNL